MLVKISFPRRTKYESNMATKQNTDDKIVNYAKATQGKWKFRNIPIQSDLVLTFSLIRYPQWHEQKRT